MVDYKSLVWKRRLTQTGKDVSYEWESFEDFMADLENIKKNQPACYAATCSHAQTASWIGTEGGFQGMVGRVVNGWPELRTKLEALLKNVELEVPRFPSMTHTRRRKRSRGDFGDTLTMHKVWSGDLDHAWERPKRVEKLALNTKRITLAFDVTANGFVTNEMAMWRAALCMLLVDSLTRAGRSFEIWVTDSTGHPFEQMGSIIPQNLWTAWCVKRTSDPIVMDRLCSMVSVGFMRCMGFAAEAAGPWTVRSSFGGALNYGLPHSLRERQSKGECVVRIGECYSKSQCLQHYKQVWEEIEARMAAQEAA